MATTSNRSRLRALALVLLATPGWPLAAAATPRLYVVDPARSHVRFHAVSRFVEADGRFHRVAGQVRLEDDRLETGRGEVSVETATIDTGNARRDDHLRSADFFDAERHPRARFVFDDARRQGERFVVTGQLIIRGVTRAVTVPVAAAVGDGTLRITGELTVRRFDFGIAYQSWLNPIRDEVTVAFDLIASAR